MCGTARRVTILLLAVGCTRSNPAFVSTSVDAPSDVRARPEAIDAPTAEAAPLPDVGLADSAPAATAPDLADATLEAAEAAADDAPADLPSAATTTVRAVQVAAGGMTTPRGGSGGDLFTDECRTSGEVAIGYAGYKERYTSGNSEYLIAVQVICARLEIPAGSTTARVVSPRDGTLRGDARGTSWRTQCPPDQVIVGYTAQIDRTEETENVRFHCAPLTVVPSPPGSVVPGTVTILSWAAGPVALPEVIASCPAGQVASGHVVRVGSWIDAFHMTCAVLSAPP